MTIASPEMTPSNDEILVLLELRTKDQPFDTVAYYRYHLRTGHMAGVQEIELDHVQFQADVPAFGCVAGDRKLTVGL